ncbi:uncharacterized protein TM35_000581060, partial [Trypanosoma theileri]
MTKTVLMRCYLLCLQTLALCCACGLVWADNPKASDAFIKPSTVGVPSLVRRAVTALFFTPFCGYEEEVKTKWGEFEEEEEKKGQEAPGNSDSLGG